MIVECWAIIIIILVMCFMVLRSGRTKTTILLLPLLIVPFVYIISGMLSGLIASFLSASPVSVKISINILALVFATLLFGGLSPNIKARTPRYAYWGFCSAFTVILELVLLFNSNLFTVAG